MDMDANFVLAPNSPTQRIFHPGNVGSNMAKFVLPQADGKAAAMKCSFPDGLVTPMITAKKKDLIKMYMNE
jgi:hypothetical protein